MITVSSVRMAVLWEEAICLQCGQMSDVVAECDNCGSADVFDADDIITILDNVEVDE